MAKTQDTKPKRPRVGGTVAMPEDKIAEALMACGGRVTDAARKLGLSRVHLHNRIAASEELKRTLDVAREEFVDEAEASLRALVKSGDVQAVIFALRTIGKKRGYVINEAPAVTVNNSTVVNTGFGEDPERQAKLLEKAARLRESAREEASRIIASGN